jgi:diguanylate cyclase (GGDEF)-like protein
MPLVLLINDEEWTTRSIESILRPQGYGVLTAYTGRQGLELAERVPPDLVFIDLQLPDTRGTTLCARLRKLPGLRPSLPIILFTSGVATRAERLEAYRSGAWDLIDPPFDPQELLARLEPYLKAKRDTDRALEAADVDTLTGCYNTRGLMRRLSEIFAETRRTRRPVACLVVAPPQGDDELEGVPVDGPERGDTIRWIGDTLRAVTRASDAVGRMGSDDFVILAPGTDHDGAARLIERLMERAEGGDARERAHNLRVGFASVSGDEPDAPGPEELLRRAANALRDQQRTNRASSGGRVQHLRN